ncbi:MAG: hypothetical protein HOP08_07615 [Cyclobacteriaceae bacterium]|nr:hypothetical protein [Cyclobacteriaceae bacterium]
MEINFDRIKVLFESLKNIGFLGRLFSWGEVKNQVIDASGDLQKLISTIESLRTENSKLENWLNLEKASIKGNQDMINRLTSENGSLKGAEQNQTKRLEELLNQVTSLTTENKQYLKRGQDLKDELTITKEKLNSVEKEVRDLRDDNSKLRKDEEFRRQDHSNAVSSLKQIQEKFQKDRERELDDKKNNEIQRLMRQKETWLNHEERVSNAIRAVCSKHTVEYVDKVPFKGEPDNTIKIIDEYVIFDAKSPASDDLSNFPSYLKNQTESVKKYAKEENVRREIFLVVPTNTLETLDNFIYRLPDYTVYIISLDALEPIIVSLKAIEQYEFAQELSPEERDNICRVLGKFAHLSKRRIQIDAFFAKQFLELVYRGESDLPKDILERVTEFEKSEKINPPIEKRAKQINLKELEIQTTELNNDANSKGIITENSMLSKSIDRLPLYTSDLEDGGSDEQGQLFK